LCAVSASPALVLHIVGAAAGDLADLRLCGLRARADGHDPVHVWGAAQGDERVYQGPVSQARAGHGRGVEGGHGGLWVRRGRGGAAAEGCPRRVSPRGTSSAVCVPPSPTPPPLPPRAPHCTPTRPPHSSSPHHRTALTPA
jgi:hypothetical protein